MGRGFMGWTNAALRLYLPSSMMYEVVMAELRLFLTDNLTVRVGLSADPLTNQDFTSSPLPRYILPQPMLRTFWGERLVALMNTTI